MLTHDADAQPRLAAFGTVKRATAHLTPEQRISSIIEGLGVAIDETGHKGAIVMVVIEQPQLWGSYQSTASLHSGALLGLHILTGALYWWATTQFKEAWLIPVTEWKGQLPKSVTQKRMEAKYNVKFNTNDESDACGLANYYISTLERTKQ